MQKHLITPNNNDQSIRYPSLPKKSDNMNFYNSTYDSSYPINSSNQINDSSLSQQQQQHQINSYSTDDLAQLETFDEQSIITHMYNRFLANQLYTYIGDILVVSDLIIKKNLDFSTRIELIFSPSYTMLCFFTMKSILLRICFCFFFLGCESISFITYLW